MTYSSRLPAIAAELAVKLDAVAKLAAEEVAADARNNVNVGAPDVHIKDHITVDHEGIGEYAVVAGNKDVFYGHILEHGSVHAGPHPFLLPAAESVAPNVDTLAKRALAGL